MTCTERQKSARHTGMKDALWLWPEECAGQNRYVQFRHDFTMPNSKADSATIQIAADTAYAFWLNGRFVHCAQFHDWPGKRSFDCIDIADFLVKGRNVLCVLAWHCGIETSQYLPGEAGIAYAIDLGPECILSGPDILYRAHGAYKTGSMPRISPQLHFAFEFDARLADDWTSKEYVPGPDWRQVQKSEAHKITGPIGPRLTERAKVSESLAVKIIAQGLLHREQGGQDLPAADLMYRDFLSTRGAGEIFENTKRDFEGGPLVIKPQGEGSLQSGVYIVVDMNAENAGIFELDIDAPSGTVVDIAYGEHLEDLRVRSKIGCRNFANRYIAGGSRQSFTHYFTRFAGRYIQLHITNFTKAVSLHYAGLRPVDYPFVRQGVFTSDSSLCNKIYDASVRTLAICAHEHYEDCPWREQALYANDARNQALAGYYCFGDYKMPFASLELLAGGLGNDGWLELCAPSKLPITIPSFSMHWVIALKDYLMYSGDFEGTKALYGTAAKMIGSWLGLISDGVLACPRGARYWHFYDWAQGLDGTKQNDCTQFAVVESERYDALLNFLFCVAIDAASDIARLCGFENDHARFKSAGESLRARSHEVFYDSESGMYSSYYFPESGRMHFAQLTQALALLARACPEGQVGRVMEKLTGDDSRVVETTLSQSYFKFESMLLDKARLGRLVLNKIEADWGSMLFQNATTFWETLKGASDFDLAGSLCHGWSAIPVYFYGGHLAGIRPTEPGFKKFSVDPIWVSYDFSAVVPTPKGLIETTKRGREMLVLYPAQLEPAVSPDAAKFFDVKFEARK